VSFWIDDECMLEQLAAIMPEVASYEAGLLDFLLRGELTMTGTDQIEIGGKGLGAGNLEVVVEDNRGVRTRLGASDMPAGKERMTVIPAPATGTRVVAVFRGVDAAGEPIVAVASIPINAR
jgi:hypothetical protein